MALVGRLARSAGLGLAFAAASVSVAGAQSFPESPIHIIIGFPRGSGADILGRYFASELSKRALQPTIVDNEPQFDSRAASRAAAAANPDGYTLLFASDAGVAASRLALDDIQAPRDGLTPIAACARMAFALVIPPAAPIKSVQGLILKLKAKKDNAFGYTSRASWIAGELFARLTGSPAQAARYESAAAAANDIQNGTLDFMMMNGASATRDIDRGLVKALAVTSGLRVQQLPDTPTMIESGVSNFVFAPWWGVYAPAKTPRAILDRLEGWVLEIDSEPKTTRFLESVAAAPLVAGSRAARSRLDADVPKWAPLVKAANLSLK